MTSRILGGFRRGHERKWFSNIIYNATPGKNLGIITFTIMQICSLTMIFLSKIQSFMTIFQNNNVRVHNIPKLKVDEFKTFGMTILVKLFLRSVIRTIAIVTYKTP